MRAWILFYRLRDARTGIARNALASAATVLIVTISLLLFGGFAWLSTGLNQLAALLEQQVQVRAFVGEGADTARLARDVAGIEGVRDVSVVTGRETFDRLAAVFGDGTDLRAAFPQDPFPDSLVLVLEEPAAAEAVVASLERREGIDEIIWGREYAEPLARMAGGLRRFGIGLSLALLGSGLLMTAVGMHLALLTRGDEIRVQRLMGVGPWGIRSQFMLEGFLLGLFSGALAAFCFLLAAGSAREALLRLLPLGGGFLPPAEIAVLVAGIGPLLGLLGAWLTSGRHAREEESV